MFIVKPTLKQTCLERERTTILQKTSRLSFFEFACLILLFYLIFIRFTYIFTYNTNLEGVEFALVHFVQMICLKGHLYGDAGKFPFLLVVHAPLYYYMMAGIMKLFCIDVINDVHTMYIIGRSIAFVLLFVNIYILLKIVALFSLSFRYKIYFVLLFVLFLPAHFYACRPDAFKVLFFVLYLYSVIRSYLSNRFVHYVVSAVYLFIGILFKQDVLVYGCVIYFIFFVSTRRIIYLVLPVIVVAFISLCMYVYYRFSGINLFKELFLYNIQYDSDITINLLLITSHYIKAIPLLFFSVFNIRSQNKMTKVLAIISINYFVLCTLFMLRIGSSLNYTYESVFLLLINAAVYIEETRFEVNHFRICAYMFMMLMLNQFIYYRAFLWTKDELRHKDVFFENVQTSKKVKKIIGDKVVFIPDMKYYLFYPETNLIYGADWHYDRYCAIALNIHIKPKFINNRIVAEYDKQFENGSVEYILIEDNDKSKRLLSQYYTSYAMLQKTDNLLIYKFKNKVQ